jgi:pimeloyl-ACP methyl ester carboxylesterase
MDSSVFAPQVAVWSRSFCLLGVHARGVGRSDAPATERYDIDTAADDVAALLPHGGHVVGASLGAAIAIELALRHPERVRSLTLITPVVTATARLLAVLDGFCRLAASASPEVTAAALLPWFFSTAFLGQDESRTRASRGLAQLVARTRAESLQRWRLGLAAWSGTREHLLGTLDVPTLIIAAGEDLLTPDAEQLAAQISSAKCLVLPRCGHAVSLEAPEAVTEAVLAHWSRTGAG